MPKGTTSQVIYKMMREYLKSHHGEKSKEELLADAIAYVKTDMKKLGPKENDLEGSLKTIWNTQKKYYPTYTTPNLLDNPNEEAHEHHLREMAERARYSAACRDAALTATGDLAFGDLAFLEIANKMFDMKKIEEEGKEINVRRFINHLINLEGIDGDAESCRKHNETVVMATACCERAITPQEFENMRREWHIKEGMSPEDAAKTAAVEASDPAKILYDILMAKVEGGVKYVEKSKDASRSILNGSAEKEPGGLVEAYRTLLVRSNCQLMFNMKDCLETIRLFGYDISNEEIYATTRKYEKISTGLTPLQTLTGQLANPYYAILDPFELVDKGVISFMNQPGEDEYNSHLYNFTLENSSSGTNHLLLSAEQEMLRRFDMQDEVGIGELTASDIECKTDPSIKTIKHRGRTIICVREEFGLVDGDIKIKFNTDIPGRLMDSALISDVVGLKSKFDALPKVKGSDLNRKLGNVGEAIGAMLGMTLGDKAEDSRMADLEEKLRTLKESVKEFSKEVKSKALPSEFKKFVSAADKFVADKENILSMIKEHKETMLLVTTAERLEEDKLASGWKIPEDQENLTPFQRFIKPVRDKQRQDYREAQEKQARKEAEKKKKEIEDAAKEARRFEDALDNAEKTVDKVEIDGKWDAAEKNAEKNKASGVKGADAEDPLKAMVSAYVDGNSQMSMAFFAVRDEIIAGRKPGELSEKEAADAKAAEDAAIKYEKEAFAGASVREMLGLFDQFGENPARFRNILKKGGLSEMTEMVKQSPHFKSDLDILDLKKPETLGNQLSNYAGVHKRVAMYILQDVSKSKQQAAEKAEADKKPQKENEAAEKNANKNPIVG